MQQTELLKDDGKKTDLPVRYSPSDAAIAEMRQSAHGLTADTPTGYQAVRAAIATCRSSRVAIEKRRVELKADALSWGRKVDSEARRLTDLLLEIEEPLKTEKARIDDEKERVRRAKEEAELQAHRSAIEAELLKKREAEEAALRLEREAEAERLRTLNARLEAERAAMAAERAKIEAAQKAERERIAAESAKIEAARLEMEAERQRAERAEFERQAKIRAEADARHWFEREHLEAEKAAAAKAEAERIEAARIEAQRPDREKLRAYAAQLWLVCRPVVTSESAKAALKTAVVKVSAAVNDLEKWGQPPLTFKRTVG